ncbi:MAG TPA: LuxR C-terminal-related transcriptional regulator [Opitutaceae bacterium]|nr:LuxR C-terminal-related transcriptional regulator [Opitutaceae bacterium]
MDGLDLLAAVIEDGLVEKSLVVSGRQDERVRVALRHLGIDGYFDTECGGVELLRRAFREVAAGGHYFNNNTPPQAGVENCPSLDRLLSTTELQVFAIIGDGSDNAVASARLGMAEATVQTHRQHIMKKLEIQTRTDLMRLAIQRGIVRITCDRILRPGFEHELGERAARSRDPFGKRKG